MTELLTPEEIKEAIKILEHDGDTFQVYTVTIRNRAVKLGIQALKAQLAKAQKADRPDREKIADLEHEQWMAWAKSLTPELNDILYKLPEGSFEADRLAARLARWASLFKPYAELTEEQKDQDRKWADQILALFPDEEKIRKQVIADFEARADIDYGHGDAKTGDMVVIQLLESDYKAWGGTVPDWQALKGGNKWIENL